MRLVPVDGNPFGEDELPKRKLVPVEGNPFAQPQTEAFMRGPKGVAEDMNPLQALMVGAGRGFSQLGAGAEQVYNAVTGKDPSQLAAKQAEADRLYKPMQEAHPLASGIGETLPAFAVPVGGATSVLGAMGRMALPGAAQALLSYGSPEERLKDAALQGAGGAVGGGLTTLAGKIISPAVGAATRAADPVFEKMAGVAKDVGIRLTPAQSGGGRAAQGVEAGLQTIPWTAGAQQAIKDTQQGLFNKSVLKSIGMDAEKASPDVLTDAATKIGAKFDAGYAGVAVPINKTAITLIDAIETKYATRLDSMQKPIVAKLIGDIKDAGPVVSGEQYHSFVSDLARAARAVGTGQNADKPTKNALNNLRSALDSSFKSVAPKDQSAMYFEARGQYKNLLTIQDSLEKSRVASGDIPAKQFYASMQRFNPNFVRGTGGELGDVARMGKTFLPDPTPNSGTGLRSFMANLLTAGGMGSGGAGISALSGGDPMQGLQAGLGGYALSKGAQRLYNSGYPTNQLLSEEMKRLLMRSGGLLGTGAAAGLSGNQ